MILTYNGSEESYNIIQNYLKSLEKGNYLIRINEIEENPLVTEADYRRLYFVLLDRVLFATGNDKDQLHEEIKLSANIDSTKSLSVAEWQDYIKKFKWFCFDKFDIML